MAIYLTETDDPDYWPCPMGADGHPTGDPAGGPCQTCWDAVPSPHDDEWDAR